MKNFIFFILTIFLFTVSCTQEHTFASHPMVIKKKDFNLVIKCAEPEPEIFATIEGVVFRTKDELADAIFKIGKDPDFVEKFYGIKVETIIDGVASKPERWELDLNSATTFTPPDKAAFLKNLKTASVIKLIINSEYEVVLNIKGHIYPEYHPCDGIGPTVHIDLDTSS